jgi:hypothetical protein
MDRQVVGGRSTIEYDIYSFQINRFFLERDKCLFLFHIGTVWRLSHMITENITKFPFIDSYVFVHLIGNITLPGKYLLKWKL